MGGEEGGRREEGREKAQLYTRLPRQPRCKLKVANRHLPRYALLLSRYVN